MSDSIEQIQKQTFRYYYQDGLAELAVGILFTGIGLNLLLVSTAPPGSPLAIGSWVLLPLLTIGGMVWVQRFVKTQKEKYVHPRTGFIEYTTKPRPYRWLVSGIILALTVSMILLPYDWLTKGSVTGGMILCVILAAIGVSVSLKRMVVAGFLCLALGVLFGYLPLSDHASLAATFLTSGPVLILLGGLAFRKHLAENPLLEKS